MAALGNTMVRQQHSGCHV